jgi:serine/threonine protein kinase/tetratricopeptide (TPR) repeat protein
VADGDAVAVGQTIAGRYRLLAEIGRGGVGTVYRAHDAKTGGEIAIKILHPIDGEEQHSSTKVGRFLREARAMRRLRSPEVVQVFDHGDCPAPDGGDTIYLTMELLVGEALRDRLKRDKKLGPADTMRVLAHIGRAIGLAHQRGIVHRDLKPANIFLCARPDGGFHCKVLDFGMVKSLAMPLATVDAVHTEHGRPLGTPYYMSPEQARGLAHVDHRSDLWAMGVIAFECLIGERPFQGNSLARVFAAIAAGDIPVPSQRGEVPPGFDGWFAKAVERDVQRRFQSAKLMIEELQEVLVDANTLSQTHTGVLTNTVSDLLQATLEAPGLSDRTLRREPIAELGSSFVGRADILAEMDRAVANHCRVLTLCGSSGSGRGRVAREYGKAQTAGYRGGVWLVDVAEASDAESMWRSLALALGAQLGADAPAARIGRALGGLGRVLVVVEHVEAVREHIARAIGEWLRAAPRAVFVVTGRRALEVPTERVMNVEPLSFPPYNQPVSFEQLRGFEGSELLLKRAVAFDRHVFADPQNSAAVGAVTRMAGGVPLALELLAARLDAQPVREVAQRLEAALIQPGGTAVITPDAVVEHAVGWVFMQHPAHERAALTQLSTFAGGFTLPAAEAVVDLARWPDAPAVAELCERLAQRGLLRNHGSPAEPRYDMHPVVERIARRQQLDPPHSVAPESSEMASSAEERHGRYFAQLGSDEALEALSARGGWVRRARYLVEAANAAAAAARAAQRRDGVVAASCALVVAGVESLIGRHAAAASALVAAVTVSETPEPLRLRCLIAQGRALTEALRYDASRRALERARHGAAELGEQSIIASAMRALGELYMHQGHMAHAHAEIEGARQLASRLGDRISAALAATSAAELQRKAGDLSAAVRLLQEARIAFHDLGARHLYAATLERLGAVHVEQGRHEGALGAYEAALSLHRELGDRLSEARLLVAIGEVSLDAARANCRELLEQAAGRAGELGALELEGRAFAALGGAHAVAGDADRAWRTWQQGEAALRATGEEEGRRELASLLCRRAAFEHGRGAHAAAQRTLADIEGIVAALKAPAPARLARELGVLRARLR